MEETEKPKDGLVTTISMPKSAQHLEEATEFVQQTPTDVSPDGGFQAWSVVVGVWCAAFASFGWLTSIGVFQEYYQNVLLKESPSTTSWIPSLQVFFMLGDVRRL